MRILLGVLFLSALTLNSQEPKAPPSYTPTEIQSLRLQVKQKDTLLAVKILQEAQANFTNMKMSLMNESDSVIKENKWPQDLIFNPDTLQFSETPKNDAPKRPGNK